MKGAEAPIADCFTREPDDDGTHLGCLEVAVLAGFEHTLDDSGCVWELKAPDAEILTHLEKGIRMGQSQSRSMAASASAPAGLYKGLDGEQVLSVRLSDYCDHPEEQWSTKSCGHVWCALCAGYVDSRTRVALRSPGPIITCNRKPRPFSDYSFHFREHNAGSCRLTSAVARKVRNSKKVATPRM